MRTAVVTLALLSLALSGCQVSPTGHETHSSDQASGHGDVHWTYSGESGPQNWGKLDQSFLLCSMGRDQSPVDLAATVKAELEPLKFAYVAGASDIENNGHTVQVNYASGSALTVDGQAFGLVQFHFHTPSEHTIGGKRYPMEVHFVHSDKDGNLAVVGVMFEDGAANPALSELWSVMPTKAGERHALPAGVNAATLLPADRSYYRVDGSLTTPPCSEGVRWLVLKSPLTVSRAQVEQFAGALPGPNARPLQPLNARVVLR